MLFYRRIFQNFNSNRSKWLQLFYLPSNNVRQIHNDSAGCWRQLDFSKSDIITHNDHIQHLNNDECNQKIPNSSQFATHIVLPFEAIPCADQPNSYSSLLGIARRCRQLLTSKWDNRFHEEIDECHHKFGPIFRKSLGSNQSGKQSTSIIQTQSKPFFIRFCCCFFFKINCHNWIKKNVLIRK